MHYNSEQQEAILHKDGPALVLAGPGSGKTAVLTARIEVLIHRYRISPSHILVLSFTRAASREIEQRFQARTGENAVTFGTIHAVFYRILKISRPRTASSVIPVSVRREYIREYLLAEAGWDDVSQEKLEQLEAELIGGGEKGSESTAEQDALRRYYEEKKRQNGLLDFTDILQECLTFFETDAEALAWWRKRFRYIMVDEYQDVSPLQQKLLKTLAGPNGNLLAVGDEDQSIYAFRGADSRLVAHFQDDFPGAGQYILNRCYRCSPQILRAAGILIAHNTHRIPKHLKSEAPAGEDPFWAVFEDHKAEMHAVADAVRASLAAGTDAAQIAVLARTRFSLRRMAAALEQEGIPCRITEKLVSDYDTERARDLFAYLRLGEGGKARADYLQIINKPPRYLSRKLFTEEIVDREALWRQAAGQHSGAGLLRLFYELDRLRELRPYAAIEYIRKEMGYDAFLKKKREEKKQSFEEDERLLDRLQEESAVFPTAAAWEKAREKLTQESSGEDEEDEKKKAGIRLLTMHGSKGLEFEHVFLPALNEGEIPGRKAVGPDAVEEERRLLYVAMTRAGRFLWLSFVKKIQGKKVLPSRFLGEIREGEKTGKRRETDGVRHP